MKILISLLMILIAQSGMAHSNGYSDIEKWNADKLRFLDSLNTYRAIAGVPPLRYSFQEDSLAKLRVSSIYRHIDSIGEEEYKRDIIEHQHYNWEHDWHTYDKKNIHPDTVLSHYAECTARLSKLFEYDEMFDKLFQGWKNSSEHWKIMMSPKYEYITLHFALDDHKHLRLRKGYFAALVLFSKGVNQRSIRN